MRKPPIPFFKKQNNKTRQSSLDSLKCHPYALVTRRDTPCKCNRRSDCLSCSNYSHQNLFNLVSIELKPFSEQNKERLTQSPSCFPCGIPMSSNVAGPLLGALLGLDGGAVAALGAGLGAGLGFISVLCICEGGALPTLPGPDIGPGPGWPEGGRPPSPGTRECRCCC